MKKTYITKITLSTIICFVFCITNLSAQRATVWKWNKKTPQKSYLNNVSEGLASYIYYPDEKSRNQALVVLDANTGRQKWKIAADGYIASSGVIDGTIYASINKQIQALDAQTGKVKWKYDYKDFLDAYIAEIKLKDNVLYVLGDELGVLALNVQTGRQIWNFRECFNLVGGIHTNRNLLSFTSENKIRFACETGEIYLLDEKTGEKFKSKTYFEAAFWDIISDNKDTYVFARGSDRKFYINSFNNETFENNWTFQSDETLSFGLDQMLVGADKVYMRETNGGLIAIDKKSGNKVWEVDKSNKRVTVNNILLSTKVVDIILEENKFYGVSEHGELTALNADTGENIWKVKLSQEKLSKPKLIDNQLLTSSKDYIYAINRLNGRVNWQIKTVNTSRQWFVDKDKLYFVANENRIIGGIKITRRPLGKRKTIGYVPITRTAKKRIGTVDRLMMGSFVDRKLNTVSNLVFATDELAYYTKTNHDRTRTEFNSINLKTGFKRNIAANKYPNISEPIIRDGFAYFSVNSTNSSNSSTASTTETNKAAIYAIDLHNNKTKWTAFIEKDIDIQIFSFSANIYYLGSDGLLTKLDKQGDPIWSRRVAKVTNDNSTKIKEFTLEIINNRVFIATPTEQITAIEATKGEVLWDKKVSAKIGGIAVDRDSVYYANDKGGVFSLDQTNSKIKWSKSINMEVIDVELVEDFLLVSGKYRQALYNDEGEQLWDRVYPVYIDLPKYKNGEFTSITYQEIFELRKGEKLKSKTENNEIRSSEIIHREGDFIFLKNSENELSLYNQKTNKTIWQSEL